MKSGKTLTLVLMMFLAYGGLASAQDTQFGNISFPNSGSEAAQPAFLKGVMALHSFEFDEARIAFEEAQRIDPDFALAYWGQAISDNHPLWAEQDTEAATKALNRLAPTHDARLAKAPTEKEKAYLEAVDVLYYSPGDKLQRDIAYSEYMGHMHEQWPDDHEIAIFYALSKLGMVRRGDKGFGRQAQAAAISLKVFEENPNHPGAAHFIIHAFDDPDHAILALPAARVYADIAPAAAHALHMPSHIFVQLGMWQRVVDSNVESYPAAMATIEKYNLPEGYGDFHALSWKAYGNLMLGHFDRAEENLELAVAAVERNKGSARVKGGYLMMRGRHMIETGEWEDVPLEPMDTVEGSNPHWVSVVGMSAAYRGDIDTAQKAIGRLQVLEQKASADGKTYESKQIAILGRQLMAVRSFAAGDVDDAVAFAKDAAETEMREMDAPSGPPVPMKPSAELYGDILLAANQPKNAVAAYEQTMAWIPNRTPSLLGLSKAADAVGDKEKADETPGR